MHSGPPPIQTPPKKSNVVLIVVIVLAVGFCLIVPILAAILFPVFSQAKLSAQKSATLSQAKNIAMSMLMYASDNDETLPPCFASTQDLKDAAMLYGPMEPIDFQSKNPAGGEFLPNPGAEALSLLRVLSPELAVLVYDSAPWERDGGRVVAYFDGHAKYVKSFDEAAMLKIELSPEE
jgi:hypothetical protein